MEESENVSEEESLAADLELSAFETTILAAYKLQALNINSAARAISPEEVQAVQALPVGSALLVSVAGSNMGARFLLDSDVVKAGRHPDSDIFLDDVTVSRRHTEFVRENEKFFLRDVGSLNGTYVDGQRRDEYVLENGSEVQIGKFRLIFYQAEKFIK